MPAVSPAVVKEKPKEPEPTRHETAAARHEPSLRATWALDVLLVVLFLSLTFLLGAFPLKDADIYWHLRTGDLIRQTGKVPQTDTFTFTREGTPWTAYYQGGSAYSAAKAGVHGFVRDVALELAEHRINVNAVAPGPIDTERFGPGLKRLNETVEYSPNHMTPLRRLGEPIEVAHAVLFLASDEASYVNGSTFLVDGGLTAAYVTPEG